MNSRYLVGNDNQIMTVLTVDQACELLEACNLLPAIQIDNLFTKLGEIPHRLKRISTLVQQVNLITEPGIDNTSPYTRHEEQKDELDKLSNSLCIDLNLWMEYERFETVIFREMSYSTALFSAALTLANINPINTLDPITQEPIHSTNRVVTTDRYQHDIFNLMRWLNLKNSNPFTGLELSKRNLARLKSIFTARLAEVKLETDSSNCDPCGDPNIDDTTALAWAHQSEVSQRVRLPSPLSHNGTREAAMNVLRLYFETRLPRSNADYPILTAASHAGLFYHARHNLNLMMVHTIMQLDGLLTPEHFNDWPPNNRFTLAHSYALIYLIREENYLPLDAINLIKTSDPDGVVVFSMPAIQFSPDTLRAVD